MTVTVASAIERTIEGFVDQLPRLAEIDLRGETRGAGSWVLSASAVAHVVEHYISGRITADEARDWAFFVRRGYTTSSALPVAPIDIDWETAREDAIAEATMRLEELGDAVDGVLPASEAEQLVRMLTD